VTPATGFGSSGWTRTTTRWFSRIPIHTRSPIMIAILTNPWRRNNRKPESGLEFGGFRETQFALGEGEREQFFDLGFFAVAGHGQFADQQVTGAFQHLLLAERQRLGLVEGDQALEDSRDFDQGAGAHAVGIFLEAVFPVGGAEVFGDREEVDNLLYFAVADHAANAHAPHIVAGHHHFEAAGFYIEQVKLFDGGADGPAADLLDNPHPVVGIDDLVADVNILVGTAHS